MVTKLVVIIKVSIDLFIIDLYARFYCRKADIGFGLVTKLVVIIKVSIDLFIIDLYARFYCRKADIGFKKGVVSASGSNFTSRKFF